MCSRPEARRTRQLDRDGASDPCAELALAEERLSRAGARVDAEMRAGR